MGGRAGKGPIASDNYFNEKTAAKRVLWSGVVLAVSFYYKNYSKNDGSFLLGSISKPNAFSWYRSLAPSWSD